MCVVDGRDLDLVVGDVLPDVKLGPVADREHTDVLAHLDASVVEVPQFGALGFRVPLAELVTEGVHALFGSCLLFVSTCATEERIEAMLFDRVEKCRDLETVT